MSGGTNWYFGYRNGNWVGNTGNDAPGQLAFIAEPTPEVTPLLVPLSLLV